MYTFIDDKFFKYYNDIWSKLHKSIKKELDSEPLYNNNKFLKAKKRYGKYSTDFQAKDAPEVGFNYIFILIIAIEFILEKVEDECKYIIKKEKI